MGFFDKLLQRDPSSRLDRASELVDTKPLEALRLLEDVARKAEEPFRTRALDLRSRAADRRMSELREKASKSEEEGFFEDAAEWLRASLDLPIDDALRQSVEAEILELERRADALELDEMERQRAASTAADFDLPNDEEQAFEVLVGMLDDDVAPRYLRAGEHEVFRRAFLALHDGRTAEALEALEEAVEELGETPEVRFERARARLVEGNLVGAREDLEAIWESFGDEPLDAAQTLSVPGLWAEAMLELGELEAMVARLDGVADPSYGDPALCARFSRGLVETGDLDRAADFLERCCAAFKRDPGFAFLLSEVLARRDDRSGAIEVLEVSIAPSCAGGSCGAPGKHLPSFRRLVELHLAEGGPENLQRVDSLLNHLAHAQQGALPPGDLRLLAAFHAAAGREQEAAEAGRQADELEAAGDTGEEGVRPVAAPSLAPGRSAL